jgi:hypothetical protein
MYFLLSIYSKFGVEKRADSEIITFLLHRTCLLIFFNKNSPFPNRIAEFYYSDPSVEKHQGGAD